MRKNVREHFALVFAGLCVKDLAGLRAACECIYVKGIRHL